MTISEAIAQINTLMPSEAKRGITPDKIREAFHLICDQLAVHEIVKVDTIDNLNFPLKKGFVEATSDLSFSETESLQIYYNDGTAIEKGDLYTWPVQKLKNIL